MYDIDIFPIFNQSVPGIWDDFLRIRMLTVRHNYNIILSDTEIVRTMNELRTTWSKKRFNFAFGAYHHGEMIGYIYGDCSRGTAYIRHLYVLPKYQKHHIGHRLLSAAERAVSINNTRTDLVALVEAEPFYKKYGYSSPLNTNKYIKKIRGCGRCQTLPLFCCSAPVLRACAQISDDKGISFNPDVVRRNHAPVFVYSDINSNIAGYCVPHPDNNSEPLICTRVPSSKCIAYSCLLHCFNSYKSHASIIANACDEKVRG